MKRITLKDLDMACARLNRLTGSPLKYSKPFKKGVPFRSNVGNFHIEQAFGGVGLNRVVNSSGGVACPLGDDLFTKRELLGQINAFAVGIEHGKAL
jgi:hypothetical protein